MKIFNLKYIGDIAYGDLDITIKHYTLGSYNCLMYVYGNTERLIKYANIVEMFNDYQSRLYYLSMKKGRTINYTPYGEQCIKNWYRIKNG